MTEQEQIMTGLWDVFNKLIWLDEYDMKKVLKGYKPSEVHCIDYIGKNEDSNVTKLADDFYMTRGAISKLTKKLIAKGLLESYQKPENRKEIYFRLTEQGRDIFEIHEKLHRGFSIRDKIVFEQLTDGQIEVIINFANFYNSHLDNEIQKLNVDMKSGGFEKL